MQHKSTISILGCGWLGLPVARRFIREGYRVKGSTTTATKMPLLSQSGLEPALIDLQHSPDGEALKAFLEADVLLISFPPGLRAGQGEAYLRQITLLTDLLQQVATPHILFISSTSVFPDSNQVVSQAAVSWPNPAAHALQQAENLFRALPGKSVTILRLAGLAGGSRHPGRFLAGKSQVPNPQAPVNLIHQEDCVEIIFRIVSQQKWQQQFNACADEHPSRQEYYTAAALSLGLVPPTFAAASPADRFKVISNLELKKELQYEFKYPDPRMFF